MAQDQISPLVASEITNFAEDNYPILDYTLGLWLNQFRSWLIWQEVYNNRDPMPILSLRC
jgi:hypothetical protein